MFGRYAVSPGPARVCRRALGLLVLSLWSARLLLAGEPSVADFKAAEQKCRATVERVMPAVVGILNQNPMQAVGMAYGSAVVVSEDGIVLTAGHVLGRAQSQLVVMFPDGRRVKAVSLGADRARDVGMAKIIEPGSYPHVDLGKSSELKPGQWCLALGHPGGVQEGRLPPLRLGRILSAGKGGTMHDGINSDATIISGDSGGPLFDLDGKLIGIHSNVGIMATQNRHVPIDLYRDQWKDLLAGKQTGELPDEMADTPTPGGITPQDIEKFNALLKRRLEANDPELLGMMKNGTMQLSPGKMKELLQKWEKAEAKPGESKPGEAKPGEPNPGVPKPVQVKPAGSPAPKDNEAFDYLKFHRLFEDRLIAGDREVLGLIKDGKMMLTPAQMRELLAKWESGAHAAAGPAKAPLDDKTPFDMADFQRLLLQHLMSGDPEVLKLAHNGRLNPTLDEMRNLLSKWKNEQKAKGPGEQPRRYLKPEAAQHKQGELSPGEVNTLMPFLEALSTGLMGGEGNMRVSKGGQPVLATLAPIVADAARSTGAIQCGGNRVALGTVVRQDGYLLTKASELKGPITCQLGPRQLPAKIVSKRDDFDLALLKVEATGLQPIQWAGGQPLPSGTWVAIPNGAGKPLALGVVSLAARPIPKAPIMMLQNAAAMGVQLGRSESEARIESLRADSPAAKAGLRPGDVIVGVQGKPAASTAEVRELIRKFKPGDKVTIDVQRGNARQQFSLVLGSAGRLAAPPSEEGAHKLDSLSAMGGTVSKRNSDFPLALTHDAVIQATHCGGPVVDLDGRAVGLDIARADRTASYAIPADKVQALVAEMLPK